jgi:uncharacterized protein YbcC (UPF0753/DUF2309 family)
MGLTSGYARLVLLAGHGDTSTSSRILSGWFGIYCVER